MKKKRKLRGWVKISLILFMIMPIFVVKSAENKPQKPIKNKEKLAKNEVILSEIKKKTDDLEQKIDENKKEQENANILEEKEQKVEEIEPEPEVEEKSIEPTNQYRLTSFYPSETSNCTGSGKCSWDFVVNENGWYTYDGKIVLAAATTYLANQGWKVINGRHYFKYYDEIDITIDGNTYRGIILDSCGACMNIEYEERLDLFVNASENAIDRGYKGNNPAYVRWQI